MYLYIMIPARGPQTWVGVIIDDADDGAGDGDGGAGDDDADVGDGGGGAGDDDGDDGGDDGGGDDEAMYIAICAMVRYQRNRPCHRY